MHPICFARVVCVASICLLSCSRMACLDLIVSICRCCFFFFFSIFSSFFFPLLNRETSFYDYSLLSTYFLSFTVLRSSTTAGVPTIIIRTRTPLTTTRTRTDRRTMPIRRRENHHTRHRARNKMFSHSISLSHE